ncbi:MAG: hypothetical protein H6837_14795 [Planctomycetes bacterium]|nr:hypothetical protein [Planctomycetota bacterium]
MSSVARGAGSRGRSRPATWKSLVDAPLRRGRSSAIRNRAGLPGAPTRVRVEFRNVHGTRQANVDGHFDDVSLVFTTRVPR